MNLATFHINLLCAWIGILLGFLSGLVFGLFFHRENWLGGYGSFKRRMYRLGHISFFGLAVVNFMFYLTAQQLVITDHVSRITNIASLAFIVGAISMPLCCLLMAHFPRTHLLFAVPVVSLLIGVALVVLTLASPERPSRPNANGQPPVTDHVSRFTHHAL